MMWGENKKTKQTYKIVQIAASWHGGETLWDMILSAKCICWCSPHRKRVHASKNFSEVHKFYMVFSFLFERTLFVIFIQL
jgi:hypothetical protein